MSPTNAARRLNCGLRPNVSLPVPKGEPRTGLSGYSAKSSFATICKAAVETTDGVKLAVIQLLKSAVEFVVTGVKPVPILECLNRSIEKVGKRIKTFV